MKKIERKAGREGGIEIASSPKDTNRIQSRLIDNYETKTSYKPPNPARKVAITRRKLSDSIDLADSAIFEEHKSPISK